MARVTINRAALNALLRGPSGPVAKHRRRVAEEIARAARRQAPRSDKPGPHMADEIKVVSRGDEIAVVADTDYAKYVHKKRPFLVEAARSIPGLRLRRLE